jgi:CubicO group peptidase (beta-lactamase class C family)
MPSLQTVSAAQPVADLPAGALAAVEQVIQADLGRVFPAASLVVVQDGAVRLNRAWSAYPPGEPVIQGGTAARYDLASLTKLFTVTALLRLLHTHALTFQTPLVELIPEFGASGPRPIDGGMDPHRKQPLPVPDALRGLTVDPRRVTLWHLLTHTSGLAPWRDVYAAAGPVPAPPDQPEPVGRAQRWDAALKMLCAAPFVGEPDGATVRYSDLGLLLLGEVVRRLAGQELDAAIQAQTLAPLGLDTVTFNPVRAGVDRMQIHPTEYDDQWRQRRVWGEVHDENACGVGGVAGHAGLFAAARDVAALGQAWLEHDARLGIPAATLALAVQEHAETNDNRRGLGWQLKARVGASAGDRLSVDTFGHTGFTGNSLWIDPQRRLVIATLTNAVYHGRAFTGFYEFRRAVHDTIARALAG